MKALLFIGLLFVVHSLAQTVFPVQPDVPFSQEVNRYQTTYYRVTASARDTRRQFEFTIYPCKGQLIWWIGNQGDITEKDDLQNHIFYFDATFDNTNETLTTVSTYNMQNYEPGEYFVGVYSADNGTASFDAFFGFTDNDPYPGVGGDGNLDIDVASRDSIDITWDKSPTDNVQYCIYVQPYGEFELSRNSGSACGLLEEYLLECTIATTFHVSNLYDDGYYVFDVVVEYLDEDNHYRGAYNAEIIQFSSPNYSSDATTLIVSASLLIVALFAL